MFIVDHEPENRLKNWRFRQDSSPSTFDDVAPSALIVANNFGDLAPALGDRVLHADDRANVQLFQTMHMLVIVRLNLFP